MSSDLLRRAAALMRERAEAAVLSPWQAVEGASSSWWVECPNTADIALDLHGENARHIASWHPAVALAVADWLDSMASRAESRIALGGDEAAVWSHERHALAVATAYLGESA